VSVEAVRTNRQRMGGHGARIAARATGGVQPPGFYDMLVAKHGLKAPWHAFTGLGLGQALVLVRGVEAAARKNGGDKLTGENVHQALLDTQFPSAQFFGFTGGDIDFSIEAPFPLKDPRINVGQVVGGKLKTVAAGVPVPKLAKW